jgi:hypothetical protein
MVNPLKIEVTEAIRLAAKREYLRTLGTGDALDAALTAAFQHPEFVRQIREQVVGCVREPQYGQRIDHAWDEFRASLGRLLGEEGK